MLHLYTYIVYYVLIRLVYTICGYRFIINKADAHRNISNIKNVVKIILLHV